MQKNPKAEENFFTSAFQEIAGELAGPFIEYLIVPILLAMLIAGVVLLCLYVFRRVFGRANAPPLSPNKNPRPIAAMDGGTRD